jgi:cytochrome c556
MTRTLQWLFLVSALLFISGIGFVIAAGRTMKSAVPATQAVAAASPAIATVKHVMRGMTMPAAATIWNSVSTIVDLKGVTENAPKNDEEWAVVAANAAVLAESANLLMTGDRVVDQGDWIKFATALRDSANTALKAAEAKDATGILAVGEVINASCDACHERYQRN